MGILSLIFIIRIFPQVMRATVGAVAELVYHVHVVASFVCETKPIKRGNS